MTSTLDHTTTTDQPATDATITAGAGVAVLQMDPADLLADHNIRLDHRLDADFLASIKTHGILQPIIGVRTAQGQVRVRYGHRRTLAALQAELPTVPVLVVADERTDDAATIERLVTQHAENEHRTGLTDTERVSVFEQLAALGLSAAKISKQTRAPRAQVDAALAVAKSDTAREALAGQALTLEQAALLVEFEDDPEAVTSLLEAITDGDETHAAQRLRNDKAEQARRSDLAAQLVGDGFTVVDEPDHITPSPVRRVDRLLTAEGEQLIPASHADCPGHAFYVGTVYGWVDATTGEPVTDDEDDDTETTTEGEDGEGVGERSHRETRWGPRLVPVAVCTDPQTHGHLDSRPSSSPAGAGSAMSEQDREAAREQRRDVIASNKAWTAAETVRLDWLRTFLSRKTPPKGTATFLALTLASDLHMFSDLGGNALAADLFGCDPVDYGRNTHLADLTQTVTEPRAQVLALGVVLCAYEARTQLNDWRSKPDQTARYLTFLAGQGYPMSTVERRACGESPDQAEADAA